MTPIKYSNNKNIVRFHYSISDLRRFIKYCYEGVAGTLLWGRDGNRLIYKVSGTFEKPRPVKRMKDLFTFYVQHNNIFDGPMIMDDQRLIPPKPIFTDRKMIFLDPAK